MGRTLALLLALAATGVAAAQGKGNATNGRDLYREKCALCHGGQGEGWDWSKKVEKPPVPVPDLARTVAQQNDQFLFTVVRDGGEGVGKTRFMPAFGFQLSDEEVWDLVAYLRTLPKKGS